MPAMEKERELLWMLRGELKIEDLGALSDLETTFRSFHCFQPLEGHCKGNCRLKHCNNLKLDPEIGFCERWRRKRKVRPAETDIAEARQAVGTSFVEHHLTIEQLKDLYPDSYIHHEFPERSDGLHSEEAR
ncbi:hypothetical protein RB195_005589 [Necator americanus]|uniref:Uncharacterized protein n=1 Tax=Necator americanus TaxID=51031 RepID=A0ABR1BSJ6_NECAM